VKEEMVVGFAIDLNHNEVILKKTHWRGGELGGIGGLIEEGKTPLEVMRWEMVEQTGLYIKDWVEICIMEGETWKVYVFSTFFNDIDNVVSDTEEKVVIQDINQLDDLRLHICIPNVRWLVPMCIEHMTNRYSYKEAHFLY
jgi:8-oxo-dGTP pyrophosphatase MutT (NUDIX family)